MKTQTNEVTEPSIILTAEERAARVAEINRLTCEVQRSDAEPARLRSVAALAKSKELAAQREIDAERRSKKVRAIDALTSDQRALLFAKVKQHGPGDVLAFLRHAVTAAELAVMLHDDAPRAALAAKAIALGYATVAAATGKDQHEVVSYLGGYTDEITIGQVESIAAMLPALARGSLEQRDCTPPAPPSRQVTNADAARALAALG